MDSIPVVKSFVLVSKAYDKTNDEIDNELSDIDFYNYNETVIARKPRYEPEKFIEFDKCSDVRAVCDRFYVKKDMLKTPIILGKVYRLSYNDINNIKYEYHEEYKPVDVIKYIQGDVRVKALEDIIDNEDFKNSVSVISQPYNDKNYVVFNTCSSFNPNGECSIYRIKTATLTKKNVYILLNQPYKLYFNSANEVHDGAYGTVYDISDGFDIVSINNQVNNNYRFTFSMIPNSKYNISDKNYIAFERCDMFYRCAIYEIDQETINSLDDIVVNDEHRFSISFNNVEFIDSVGDIPRYHIVGSVGITEINN